MLKFIAFVIAFAWVLYGFFAAWKANEDGEGVGYVVFRMLTAAPVDLFNWIKSLI